MAFSTRGRLVLVFGWTILAAAVIFFGGESPAQDRRANAIWSYQEVREVLVVWNREGCDKTKTTCIKAGLKVLETNRSGGYHVCKCPGGTNLPETVKKLKHEPVIAHVEPNVVIRLRDPKGQQAQARVQGLAVPRSDAGLRLGPNDPSFGRQWGMESIRAPHAWQCVRTSPVVVAVIDSGVDFNHEDLRNNMWRNPREIAGDGVDNDNNGIVDDVHGFDAQTGSGDPMDENGHGTHCAGIIGAVGGNGVGVTGVNWSVKIMAVKVFDAEGKTTLNAMIKGIDYAWRNGARVANASFGGSPRSKLQRDAIARAEAAGMLLVAAAGNESVNNDTEPLYPASFGDPYDVDGALRNIIAVASVDGSDTLSDFSNYGERSVHLAAPGGASGRGDADKVFSTISSKNAGGFGAAAGGKYGFAAGTSMATPHVAGAAALVWGHPSYQNASAREVKDALLNRTRRLPSLSGKCSTGGRLDLGFLCATGGRLTILREPLPLALPRPILPRR